ncbi:MAG: hypothetical protein BWZ10_01489 [candidate division BRC1 bacterium ADurb.BinA364]|nr:MAG: hypothetical protein BWZ10_01489 [candidate division BRC1 bacterium ADurb.BinA364]
MHDSQAMGIIERLEDLAQKMQHRLLAEFRMLQEHFLQVLAFDEFHRQEFAVARFEHIVNAHDMRMREAFRRPGFLLEALDGFGVRHERFGQHLERDNLVERPVASLVHNAHRAAVDLLDDLEPRVFQQSGLRGARRPGHLAGLGIAVIAQAEADFLHPGADIAKIRIALVQALKNLMGDFQIADGFQMDGQTIQNVL